MNTVAKENIRSTSFFNFFFFFFLRPWQGFVFGARGFIALSITELI